MNLIVIVSFVRNHFSFVYVVSEVKVLRVDMLLIVLLKLLDLIILCLYYCIIFEHVIKCLVVVKLHASRHQTII